MMAWTREVGVEVVVNVDLGIFKGRTNRNC